jgi:hypothetical protein
MMPDGGTAIARLREDTKGPPFDQMPKAFARPNFRPRCDHGRWRMFEALAAPITLLQIADLIRPDLERETLPVNAA